jgi:hypothetical protein
MTPTVPLLQAVEALEPTEGKGKNVVTPGIGNFREEEMMGRGERYNREIDCRVYRDGSAPGTFLCKG